VTRTIALLGDDRGHRSHQELNALVPQLAEEYGVAAAWVPTDSSFDLASYDGVWLVPGSPYADDDAVIDALRVVRSSGIPFLGTCSGMQYAAIELLRSELGQVATHAETAGERTDNAVVPLACSLYGVESTVTPVPGSRFAEWVREPFVGMHYCNYAASAETVAALQHAGVVVGATGEEIGAEVLEFPGHPFYVVSMFQPHLGASQGAPIHPLVRAFLRAVTGRTHRVFSYGTLRQPEVQRSLYGGAVPTVGDRLPGYRIDWLQITDPGVIATSGSDRHPILRRGAASDAVEGAYLELSDDDLAATDAYEVDDYSRHEVTLASGVTAWAYLGDG
jgi:hypothetical protein